MLSFSVLLLFSNFFTITTPLCVPKGGYIVHKVHPWTLTEGLGSWARVILYPIIELSLKTGLTPLLNPIFHDDLELETKEDVDPLRIRNYTSVNILELFGFDEINGCTVTELRELLPAEVIDYAKGEDNSLRAHVTKIKKIDSEKIGPYLLELHRLSHVGDISTGTIKSLASQTRYWETLNDSEERIQVRAHLRRGDTTSCLTQKLKCHSSVENLFSRLGHIFKVESRLRGCIDLEVFTEMNFGEEEEKLLRSKMPKVKIFRGGPSEIVHHIQRMGAADIFFPSSSAFSVLASYLLRPHALILTNKLKGIKFMGRRKTKEVDVLKKIRRLLSVKPDACQKRRKEEL